MTMLEERFIINFNEDKIKEKYTNILKEHCSKCNSSCSKENIKDNIKCMKQKWDINRTDWEQGFDSDCYGHCCQVDICFQIFKDKECHNKGHMDLTIVEI